MRAIHPGLRVGERRLHTRRATVLGEHALGSAAHDHAGAGVHGVAEIGATNVELGAGAVAEADVAGRIGRVARPGPRCG